MSAGAPVCLLLVARLGVVEASVYMIVQLVVPPLFSSKRSGTVVWFCLPTIANPLLN